MRIAIITATIIFVLDQATKLIIVQGMNLIERGVIEVLPPFLTFRMAWNTGINFGLFSNQAEFMRWVLIAVALAISAWVWIWIKREGAGRWAQISAGLLIGGALGNVPPGPIRQDDWFGAAHTISGVLGLFKPLPVVFAENSACLETVPFRQVKRVAGSVRKGAARNGGAAASGFLRSTTARVANGFAVEHRTDSGVARMRCSLNSGWIHAGR